MAFFEGFQRGRETKRRRQAEDLLGLQRQQAMDVSAAQEGRRETLFDQQQQAQQATILNQSARALKGIDPNQWGAVIQSISPKLQQFGIDPNWIDPNTLTPQALDQVIASTQPFMDNSSPMSEFQRQNLELQRQRLKQQAEITPAQQERLRLQGMRQDPGHQQALKEAEERGKLQAKLDLGLEYERESALVKNEVSKMISQQGQSTKLADVDNALNILIPKGDIEVLDKIYGKGEAFYPDALRSQEGLDALAARDQLVSMLQLGARGELKGQGPITEGEQNILSRAATMLGNPSISPTLAKRQVERAVQILRASAGKADGSVRKDGELMTDAQGNRAIVYPDGTFKELN